MSFIRVRKDSYIKNLKLGHFWKYIYIHNESTSSLKTALKGCHECLHDIGTYVKFILSFCKIINDMAVSLKLRVCLPFSVLLLKFSLFVILKFIHNTGEVDLKGHYNSPPFTLDGNNWYTEVAIICIIICLWYFGLN